MRRVPPSHKSKDASSIRTDQAWTNYTYQDKSQTLTMQNYLTTQTMSRMDTLLGSDYSIVPFRDLPRPYQLAVGHYMAIDGEAWAEALPKNAFWPSREQQRAGLGRALPRIVELFGDIPFGVARLPSEKLRTAIMQTIEMSQSFATWEAYHAWYIKGGDIPAHGKTNRWPVILSDFEDEFIQDGWHRLHCYLKRADDDIPAVFYPRDHHKTPRHS